MFPTVAEARCLDTPIPVSAPNQVDAGTVDFQYGFCWDTIASHYTVSVFHDGKILEGFPASYSLSGKNGVISGRGSFTATEGRYVVRVLYYSKLVDDYLASGEAVIQTNESSAEPVGSAEGAELKLSMKASKQKRAASWLLSVKNVSLVSAKNGEVCAKITRNTEFVSASSAVIFRRGQACFALGTIEPGKTRRVRIKLNYAKPSRYTLYTTAKSNNSLNAYSQQRIKI